MKKYDYNNENLETNDSGVKEPGVAYVGTRYTVHGTRWDESETVGDNVPRRGVLHTPGASTPLGDRNGTDCKLTPAGIDELSQEMKRYLDETTREIQNGTIELIPHQIVMKESRQLLEEFEKTTQMAYA